LIGEGDLDDICRVRADWWRAGREQGFHVADSAQHYEISVDRPANGDLIFCDGGSLIAI